MARDIKITAKPQEDPLITADPDEGPGAWHPFEGPLHVIPEGRTEVYQAYGDPGVTYPKKGVVKVSLKWERANLVMARNLPGYGKPVYVHRLVEPYLREAMRRAAIAAPGYVIHRLGCFAPRHQRHDPSRPLSTHTWALGPDINPDTNKPYTKGDMPAAFVAAWTSVGFEWGGDWVSYPDPMHMQLCRS